MTRKLFDSMDEDSKRFYSRIFNTVVLNNYAVKRGWFDARFCDSEDPQLMQRWREALPQIAMLITVEKRNREDGE